MANEVRSSHGVVKLVTWLIVIGLGALLFMWWQGRLEWRSEVESAIESVPALRKPKTVPESVESAGEPVFSTSVAPAEPLKEPFEMEPAGAESSAFEPQPSFSETEEPLALSAETGETEVLLEGLPPPIEAVSRPEPPSEPVSAEPAAAVPGQLMFLFSGPCWVEVRDASGKARIFGEMREGARRSVDANLGPFSITLGNADVVELTVNGQAYDLTPHVRGNVARFSLDPSKI